jgi:hypothetical protein
VGPRLFCGISGLSISDILYIEFSFSLDSRWYAVLARRGPNLSEVAAQDLV